MRTNHEIPLPPPTPANERPPGITCEMYTRGEGKRCLHYIDGGTCARPDEFVCSEWSKLNGPNKRPLPAPVVAKPPVPRDLFGNPQPEITPPEIALPTPKPPMPPKLASDAAPVIDVEELRGFTTEDINSFKALGLEVHLHSETYGDLWLVPAYTAASRQEITPEHAATLARVMSVFPGSHIVSFSKTNPTTNSPTLSAQSAPSRSAHDVQEHALEFQPP